MREEDVILGDFPAGEVAIEAEVVEKVAVEGGFRADARLLVVVTTKAHGEVEGPFEDEGLDAIRGEQAPRADEDLSVLAFRVNLQHRDPFSRTQLLLGPGVQRDDGHREDVVADFFLADDRGALVPHGTELRRADVVRHGFGVPEPRRVHVASEPLRHLEQRPARLERVHAHARPLARRRVSWLRRKLLPASEAVVAGTPTQVLLRGMRVEVLDDARQLGLHRHIALRREGLEHPRGRQTLVGPDVHEEPAFDVLAQQRPKIRPLRRAQLARGAHVLRLPQVGRLR
mmetsp:Transcript_21165/g.65322  ORF Transcript_21165/g.65322 Transcript_21165/m.65322 type:complete len:286 (-) Transcript_21165:28-885(-)